MHKSIHFKRETHISVSSQTGLKDSETSRLEPAQFHKHRLQLKLLTKAGAIALSGFGVKNLKRVSAIRTRDLLM